MSKIKVTVNSISQANEIIKYWGDKEVELLVEVKVKENTTADDSGASRSICVSQINIPKI